MNVGVAPEPAIVPGLVGVEIVEDDVNGRVGVSGDDIIHEVEEFDAPPTRLVRGGDLAVATSKAANKVLVPLRL